MSDRIALVGKKLGFPEFENGGLQDEQWKMGPKQNPVDRNALQQSGNSTDSFQPGDLDIDFTGTDQPRDSVAAECLQCTEQHQPQPSVGGEQVR